MKTVENSYALASSVRDLNCREIHLRWSFSLSLFDQRGSSAESYLTIALVAYAAALKYARHQPTPSLPAPRSTSFKPSILFWLAGIAVVLLPFGLYWAAQGALPSMFKQLIAFPITTYVQTSSLPFPPLRSGLTFGPDAVVILY